MPPSPTGDYPSTTYNANKTKINNCCRNDGNYDKPIHLPKHQPFALIEQGFKGCQSIVGKAMIYIANYFFLSPCTRPHHVFKLLTCQCSQKPFI